MPMIQVDQQTKENKNVLKLLRKYCTEEAVFADCKNGDKLRKPFRDVVAALQAEIEKDEPDTEMVFMIESRMMQFINRLHHSDESGYHDYDAEAAVAYLDKYHNLNGKYNDVLANKLKITTKYEKNSRPWRRIAHIVGGTGLVFGGSAIILYFMQPKTENVPRNFFGWVEDKIQYGLLHKERPVADNSQYTDIANVIVGVAVVLILVALVFYIILLIYRATVPKLSEEEKQAKGRLNELADIQSAFENVSKMISELEEY